MELADWLKAEAAANFRTINAELLVILHEAMRRRGDEKLTSNDNG
ncbi:Arc-like DNA binding domain-containing protein [Pseudogulbenkiania subflava DSM 22618]|uniref:Arc-like DNA binding domain-containing protein n=2 Tax=Pseudogulbenkiania subflava TaxID=451637 RepID=A0A1Y6CE04_9NEIS|nr:Arc-like DNA binding domain-containing protein [Pseudogulbenkiania subflava DSM 22618]